MDLDVKRLLKEHAYQNIPLRYDDAYNLGLYALQGCAGDELAQIQSIALLCALHTRATYQWICEDPSRGLPRSAAEQIAGICAAVFEHDIAVSEHGFLEPNVEYAMDNCGMGGDLLVTANVSTLAALVAATAGIPMCKHGSPANADAGKHGSSDFIKMLGIKTLVAKQTMSNCVEQENFGYTEALDTKYKLIHQQTHTIAMLPHMNDIIGPITNPLHPRLLTRRVLGSNHLIQPRVLAEAYVHLNERGITNLRHGIFVRGFGDTIDRGMDELSICQGGTQVAELCDGHIKEYRLDAENFGLQTVPVAAISPQTGMSKGEFSLGILRGQINGPALTMVLANAALLFHLADPSRTWRESYAHALEIFRSGGVYEKALRVGSLTQA